MQLRHSTTHVNFFYIFDFVAKVGLMRPILTDRHTHRGTHTHTQTETNKPMAISEIWQTCLTRGTVTEIKKEAFLLLLKMHISDLKL